MVGNFEQCDHRGTSKLRDEDARVISIPYSPSICFLLRLLSIIFFCDFTWLTPTSFFLQIFFFFFLSPLDAILLSIFTLGFLWGAFFFPFICLSTVLCATTSKNSRK